MTKNFLTIYCIRWGGDRGGKAVVVGLGVGRGGSEFGVSRDEEGIGVGVGKEYRGELGGRGREVI